jgi:hypothetical protein
VRYILSVFALIHKLVPTYPPGGESRRRRHTLSCMCIAVQASSSRAWRAHMLFTCYHMSDAASLIVMRGACGPSGCGSLCAVR